MIYIKNIAEIEKLKESNYIVAETLRELKGMIKPGIATIELEKYVLKKLEKKK